MRLRPATGAALLAKHLALPIHCLPSELQRIETAFPKECPLSPRATKMSHPSPVRRLASAPARFAAIAGEPIAVLPVTGRTVEEAATPWEFRCTAAHSESPRQFTLENRRRSWFFRNPAALRHLAHALGALCLNYVELASAKHYSIVNNLWTARLSCGNQRKIRKVVNTRLCSRKLRIL